MQYRGKGISYGLMSMPARVAHAAADGVTIGGGAPAEAGAWPELANGTAAATTDPVATATAGMGPTVAVATAEGVAAIAVGPCWRAGRSRKCLL